jgi:hypothetical protein
MFLTGHKFSKFFAILQLGFLGKFSQTHAIL